MAGDIAAVHAAFVIRGVEQRCLEALDGRLDGVAVGAGHRADDGGHLVALDQLGRALDRRLRFGLVICADDLERAAVEHAAGRVRLLERHFGALRPLLAQHLETAREGLQDPHPDRLGRVQDARRGDRHDRRRRALQQLAA
jgi:hypothetical protein